MRPQDIISNLQKIGYRIRLDGDQVILKIDQPPEDKKIAQMLIDEARKYKTAIIQELKAKEWSATNKQLIEWFLSAQVPEAPFQLRQAEMVANPIKFWVALRKEIECGADGCRARTGVLQSDLRALKARFN